MFFTSPQYSTLVTIIDIHFHKVQFTKKLENQLDLKSSQTGQN